MNKSFAERFATAIFDEEKFVYFEIKNIFF